MGLNMNIKDKVYGNKTVNDPVLIELINSRSVQRLKGLNQYKIPDTYYRRDKQNYSWYEHSVGVMLLLKKLDADVEQQIAGLLHGVSHYTFSHLADRFAQEFLRLNNEHWVSAETKMRYSLLGAALKAAIGKGIILPKKFRYVDPLIACSDSLIKLSDISDDFRTFIGYEKENSQKERRYKICPAT